MLGILFISIGLLLFIVGAVSASLCASRDSGNMHVVVFFTKIVGPLLGGAILFIFGLKEFW